MNYHITKKSSNKKIGKIPATVSHKDTCPDSCPLKDNGCYASAGFYTNLHWKKVSEGERGTDWAGFLAGIEKFGQGLWRHNVSGDLRGSDDLIDTKALKELTAANGSRRGFTYTHYPMTKKSNRDAVQDACREGFTVNASTNNVSEAAEVFKKHNVPTVTVLASDAPNDQTVDGVRIVACPAEKSEKVTCLSCGICQKAERDYVIGFHVHGSQTKKADLIASA